MVPPQPTAKQLLALGQLTPRSGLLVPEICVVQVLPPSLVAEMVPSPATTKQVVVLGQLTPWAELPGPE